jgi:hypothetical protein
MNIDMLAKTVLSASKKSFFRPKPIFKAYAKTSAEELMAVEKESAVMLPDDLKRWLLTVGYGDVADELSFRKDWLAVINRGKFRGSMIFAQDILGNFYAFDSKSDHIYYLSRSEQVFARMSENFLMFMTELVRRDYKLVAWTETLESHEYD